MSKRIHAFSDDALGTMDAVAIADAIATEAANAAIQRAEKVNPTLGAIAFARPSPPCRT